jgi:multiple sugar transport system permease protein
MGKATRTNLRNGLLFILPWILGFVIFTIYPICASIYYSLCGYDGIAAPHFVGLYNYKTLLMDDPIFRKALWNTLYMIAIGLPITLFVSLALAFLLNLPIRGMSFYRTLYYLPSITPVVATSALWMWLLNPQVGLINDVLRHFSDFMRFMHLPGLDTPGWLIDPVYAKPALILMGLWGAGGGMIIYLAGLQDVPVQLYEAAELDGATSWQRLVNVTLPSLSPIILFNVVIGLIGSFQYFTQVYVMTNGGPQDATRFYALYLFENAFVNFKMGYASAMAWILFLLTLVVTLIVFKTSVRWVYYPEGEGE